MVRKMLLTADHIVGFRLSLFGLCCRAKGVTNWDLLFAFDICGSLRIVRIDFHKHKPRIIIANMQMYF